MKSTYRRLTVFLLVMLLAAACVTSASAKNGDVAGNYYYTDIKTYLYYSPITSYNIGGKTVLDAEILNWHYGFDVYWHAATRRLDITDKGGTFNSLQAMSGELCRSAAGTPGKVAGHYYKTDIATTLNGKEIESYNIGGRTCIVAEDMRSFGYDVAWDAGNRTLTITKPMDFYSIDTDYGAIKTRNNYEKPDLFFTRYDRGILLTNSNGAQSELTAPSGYVLADGYGVSYVRLSDLCAVLKAECTLRQTTLDASGTWPNGMSYHELYYTYSVDFTYDKNVAVALKPAPSGAAPETPAWRPDGKCYKINDVGLSVNGETGQFLLLMGGREYADGILVVDGNVYLPAYMAAKLLGYSSAE
ncbi:hypothetical protein SAMN02745823_00531 [Sporobacter termitidis DSM 10068]|uniref:Copper amine oxidase N-terminal domain-containing protein n=1 Tax=Sporobacter termitidis DSM 10068 TaxID=1123282 RepID=A0A1M5UHX2_9FIRM|nr:hypothetical protein [Sporobacter termitidis]SHH62531.1 hypothetical protein SAMN02745823_00531 [Sporobacter termitidis DSM 10068]